jgi:hypothetical protein
MAEGGAGWLLRKAVEGRAVGSTKGREPSARSAAPGEFTFEWLHFLPQLTLLVYSEFMQRG